MMEKLEVATDNMVGEDQTLRETINSMNLSSHDRRVMDVMERTYISTDFGSSAEELSSQHWLDDSETKDFNYYIFGQQMREGYSQMFHRLIEENSISIQFNSNVSSVEIDEERKLVVITTNDGIEFYAKQVICTFPLGVLKARKVKFKPALSKERLAAIDVLGMGNLFKVFMEYPSGSNLFPMDASGAYRIPSNFTIVDNYSPYYFLNGIHILIDLHS